jgi:hypothetical protein
MAKKKTDSGQAVIEYVILLAITTGIMLYFVRSLSTSLNNTIPKWGGSLEVQLRAGAAPASLWKK